jgi:K+-transporting ATPase ATPase A chain
MNMNEWLQTVIFFIVLLALTKPLGIFMMHVYQGDRTFLTPVLKPVENLLYRFCGVDQNEEMAWQRYARAMVLLPC